MGHKVSLPPIYLDDLWVLECHPVLGFLELGSVLLECNEDKSLFYTRISDSHGRWSGGLHTPPVEGVQESRLPGPRVVDIHLDTQLGKTSHDTRCGCVIYFDGFSQLFSHPH